MCPAFREHQDPDELLADVRREFCDGLAGRVQTLRCALERLACGYDAEAAGVFYRTAHSLKGTAASFEADELVGPAAALAEIGLRWSEVGGLDLAELGAALDELERLTAAVQGYAARTEGNAAG